MATNPVDDDDFQKRILKDLGLSDLSQATIAQECYITMLRVAWHEYLATIRPSKKSLILKRNTLGKEVSQLLKSLGLDKTKSKPKSLEDLFNANKSKSKTGKKKSKSAKANGDYQTETR